MTVLDQILGVCIEFVGTTLSICGLNGQKHASMRAQNNDNVNTLNLGFIVAFCVFAIGEATQLAAQGFGTQALVASVSNVSLCTNALIAYFVFKEHLGYRDFAAIFIILCGTIMACWSAPDLPNSVDDYTVDRLIGLFKGKAYISFFFLSVGIVCILTVIAINLPPPKEQKSNFGAYVYAVLAATNGSIVVTLSSIFMKLVRNTWDGQDQFGSASTYFIGVGFLCCASLNLIFLNKGMRDYESMVMIPFYYSLNTAMSVTAGLLYYKTYANFTPATLPCFVLGLTMSIVGILILASRKYDSEGAIERWKEQTRELSQRLSTGRGSRNSLSARLLSPTSKINDDDDDDGDNGDDLDVLVA